MSYFNTEKLLSCALNSASVESARSLVVGRMTTASPDREQSLLWRSAGYVVDFEYCRDVLDEAAEDDRDFLWFIRDRVAPGRGKGERFSQFSIEQLVFVVEAFGTRWPWTDYPIGIETSGDNNPWDASEFIRGAIYVIAGRPDSEATEALQKLIDNHSPSYADLLRHALALQRRARRDSEYSPPTVGEVRAVMAEDLPEGIDDMRAYFAARLETLQERIRGSNTDMWQVYWDGDRPRAENFCRNRIIEQISGQLHHSIRFVPEMHMPDQKRADIAAIRNQIGLPVEIKGQWHREVWDAASDQLEAQYTRDWHAEGRGGLHRALVR